MKKKLLAAFLLIFTLTACNSYRIPERVAQVSLGMTKEQVINIVGNSYIAGGAVDHPDGVMETLTYRGTDGTPVFDEQFVRYIFHFLNGRLVEWHRDPPF